MHELSIAQSLFELVDQKRPDGQRVTTVYLKVGPLQAVDPDALKWAWQSLTQSTAYGKSQLEIEPLPWTLHCPDCQHTWESADLYELCPCGQNNAYPQGGHDLLLDAIDVAEDRRDN